MTVGAGDVLVRRPDLRTSRVPVAVEFACTVPQPCWAGINVSVDTGSAHVVHERAVASLVDAVELAF